MEVTHRFKGLDLIDRVPEELWMEVCDIVQEAGGSRPSPRTAKSLQWCPTLSDPMDCSLPGSSVQGIFQARVLEWGAIAFSEKKRSERQRRKGKIEPLECRVPKNSKER